MVVSTFLETPLFSCLFFSFDILIQVVSVNIKVSVNSGKVPDKFRHSADFYEIVVSCIRVIERIVYSRLCFIFLQCLLFGIIHHLHTALCGGVSICGVPRRGLKPAVPDLLNRFQLVHYRLHRAEDTGLLGEVDLVEGFPDLLCEVLDEVRDLLGQVHVLPCQLGDGFGVVEHRLAGVCHQLVHGLLITEVRLPLQLLPDQRVELCRTLLQDLADDKILQLLILLRRILFDIVRELMAQGRRRNASGILSLADSGVHVDIDRAALKIGSAHVGPGIKQHKVRVDRIGHRFHHCHDFLLLPVQLLRVRRLEGFRALFRAQLRRLIPHRSLFPLALALLPGFFLVLLQLLNGLLYGFLVFSHLLYAGLRRLVFGVIDNTGFRLPCKLQPFFRPADILPKSSGLILRCSECRVDLRELCFVRHADLRRLRLNFLQLCRSGLHVRFKLRPGLSAEFLCKVNLRRRQVLDDVRVLAAIDRLEICAVCRVEVHGLFHRRGISGHVLPVGISIRRPLCTHTERRQPGDNFLAPFCRSDICGLGFRRVDTAPQLKGMTELQRTRACPGLLRRLLQGEVPALAKRICRAHRCHIIGNA